MSTEDDEYFKWYKENRQQLEEDFLESFNCTEEYPLDDDICDWFVNKMDEFDKFCYNQFKGL